MEIKQRIYWDNLSYECQEDIKADLLTRFLEDPETLEDITIKVQNNCIDDEEDFESLTQEKKDWKIKSLAEDMVDDFINREFYGEITIGE